MKEKAVNSQPSSQSSCKPLKPLESIEDVRIFDVSFRALRSLSFTVILSEAKNLMKPLKVNSAKNPMLHYRHMPIVLSPSPPVILSEAKNLYVRQKGGPLDFLDASMRQIGVSVRLIPFRDEE